MTDRNDNCTTCGGAGFTVDHNGEEEFMTGCHECFVAAHEADSEDLGALIDRVMDKGLMIDGRRLGLVDIAKMGEDALRRLAA